MVGRDRRGRSQSGGKRRRWVGRGLEVLEARWMFSTDMAGVRVPETEAMVMMQPYLDEPVMEILPVDDAALIREPYDWNPPNVTTVLDDQGRLLSETYEFDADRDGTIDSRHTSEYQYDGNTTITSFTEDRGADGIIEYHSRSSITTDANGNFLASSYEADHNGDGIADSRDSSSYTYNSAGLATSYVSTVDSNADGVADSIFSGSYFYDGAGRLTSASYESDGNGDGVIDQRSTDLYVYDASGLLLSSQHGYDENGDGAPEYFWSRQLSYDANGLVQSETSRSDADGDGIAERMDAHAYQYNSDGSLSVSNYTSDHDGNGSVDYASTERYAYDASGNLLTITAEIDENGDGVIDETVVMDTTIILYEDVLIADGGLVKPQIGRANPDGTIYYLNGTDPLGRGENSADSGSLEEKEGEIVTVGEPLLGDVNSDGVFDSHDLVLVLQAGQYEDDVVGNSTWASGDWDGDGEFTDADLVLVLQSGRYEGGPSAAAQDRATARTAATDELLAADMLPWLA